MCVIRLYTDGSCDNKTRHGGWAYVIKMQGSDPYSVGGYARGTTSQRMEMQALISGLKACAFDSKIVVHCDSKYVVQHTQSRYWENWRENNWKTSHNTEVRNQDLWHEIELLTRSRDFTIFHVKGHAGQPENEMADKVAKGYMKLCKLRYKEH